MHGPLLWCVKSFQLRTIALYRHSVTDNIAAVFALKSMCCLMNMLNVMTEGIVHCTGIHSILENCRESSSTIGTWWRWVVNITPQLPSLRERIPVPIETSMHRPQNLSGWRKSLACARIWIPDQLAHSLLNTRQYYRTFSVTSKQGLFRVSMLKGNNNPTTTSDNITEHLHLHTHNHLRDFVNKQLLMHVTIDSTDFLYYKLWCTVIWHI